MTTAHVRQRKHEAVEVRSPPVVESEGSLVNIAEQTHLGDRNVGPRETALKQGPEVLDSVSVDDAVDLLADPVVDDIVRLLFLRL